MLSLSSYISSFILDISLPLTKFVGQNKIPVLEWILAWCTVAVFGLRYVIDYIMLRWKLYGIAKEVVKAVASTTAKQSFNEEMACQETIEATSTKYLCSSLPLCGCVSLCPLAHTRKEMSVGIDERWENIRRSLLLASSYTTTKTNTAHANKHAEESEEAEPSDPWSKIVIMTKDWADEEWIQIVRSDLRVRKEISYLMFALSSNTQQQSTSSSSTRDASIILSKFQRLWPMFLELPSSVLSQTISVSRNSNDDGSTTIKQPSLYDISLIVPMYREKIADIRRTLTIAYKNCGGDPKKIQVVVVHVESFPNDFAITWDDKDSRDGCGGNGLLWQQLLLQHEQQEQQQQNQTLEPNLLGAKIERPSCWGDIKLVTIPFGSGGGRGKALNTGAKHATAPILTFLHADTLMPLGWDEKIKGALQLSYRGTQQRQKNRKDNIGEKESVFPHACAFTMAINDANESSSYFLGANNSFLPSFRSKPPGLVGAEWLAVLRCYCGLPYGDSVLSFSRPMFDYMGAYPEQPLMEDYEVMDWLRLRSVLLSSVYKITAALGIERSKNDNINRAAIMIQGEGLVLLRDRAKCSPRRWNNYGVAYTSLVNAICIFRYKSNETTAEELCGFYYHYNSDNTSAKPMQHKI